MANEQKYLESVLAQGGGAASWALNQAKSYGITLNQPTAQPAATPGGGTAAPKAAPAPAPTSGGGGAPGPTADPRDLPPADLEWLAQFNSQGQGQQGAPSPSSPEYIFNVATMIQGGLDEIRQQVDEKNMAFFNSLTNQFYTEFDAQLNSVMSTFQEQMGGVDPATKAALDQLRESTQEYRKTMMEDLNRRGLLQSGIAIESDLRLNKNQLTAEQQILAERVADLQNRMTSAMMQFSQSKLQAMQQFGVMGMNITQQGGQQQLDAFNTAMNQALSQANLQQGAFQADRAFQEGRRQFDQSFTENQRQFDEKMSMSQAEAEQAAKQFMATMGYNWANLSHKQQQDAISNEMKKQEMKFNQDQVTGAGETQRAIMLMQEYGSREEAMANFQRPEVIQEMIRLGVNVNEVYAAIQKMKSGGATPGSSFMPK
ncbi:MAG: hypothetical protein KGZ63_00745 [Clostridiales bacterium]|nr:hypothetical protein [Clostridiales bacterium]